MKLTKRLKMNSEKSGPLREYLFLLQKEDCSQQDEHDMDRLWYEKLTPNEIDYIEEVARKWKSTAKN